MAKPNYQFEKRQRELQKKRKKEAKANRKAAESNDSTQERTAPADPGVVNPGDAS
jgi:ribosome assembly protein YihI (activator of Der GTPase)